jgi:hypothetical protein
MKINNIKELEGKIYRTHFAKQSEDENSKCKVLFFTKEKIYESEIFDTENRALAWLGRQLKDNYINLCLSFQVFYTWDI